MSSVRLSVNVNKIATLRNSRGGSVPSVVDAVRVCLEAGATGITVHPRADERHIRRVDVREIAAMLVPRRLVTAEIVACAGSAPSVATYRCRVP